MTHNFILGSSSRWRRDLFSKHFSSSISNGGERDLPGAFYLDPAIDEKDPAARGGALAEGGQPVPAERMAQCIARAKARALVANKKFENSAKSLKNELAEALGFPILLCLDQVVRFRGEVREKPATHEEARQFLTDCMSFPDDPIECVNGICIYGEPDGTDGDAGGGRFLTTFEISSVKFEGLTTTAIGGLIADGRCLSSAGGFVVEDMGDGVKAVLGSSVSTFEGIQGLPVNTVRRLSTLILPANGGGRITHALFDMDGLLLNTEEKYTVAHDIICDAHNVPRATWEVKEQITGRPAQKSSEIFLSLMPGLPLSVGEYLKKRDEIPQPLFAQSRFLPGAEQLLLKLHVRGVPVCLATSSSRKLMEVKTTLTKETFAKVFGDNRICGDEIAGKGKPEPEIFMRALELISQRGEEVSPRAVLVFEDSAAGVEAGLAAGYRVCMIPDSRLSSAYRGFAAIELPSLEWFDVEQFL